MANISGDGLHGIPKNITFNSVTATTADINGGTIDGTTIGATTPAAGTFTTLSGTTVAGGMIATSAEAVAGTATDHLMSPAGDAAALAVIANPKAFSQGVNMTAAASGSSGIAVADNYNIDFGTGNFTLVWRGSLPDWTPSALVNIINKYQGVSTDGWMLRINTDGTLLWRAITATGINHTKTSTTSTGITDGHMAELALVITRETSSAAGSVVFYVNGVQLGTSVALTAAATLSLNNSENFMVGGYGSVRYTSTSYFVATFNRALTAAEVLDLYRNGIAFADKWGSQTSIITGNDSTFAGASNWANVDIDAYDETDDLTITASAAAQYCTLPVANATTVSGKKYRLVYDVANLVSTWTIKDFGGTQTIDTIDAEGTGQSIEFTASTTGGLRIVAVADTSSADIDNVYLYEIGATLALESEGIHLDKWYDSSSNNLAASYPALGWNLIRQPAKKRIKQPTPTAETTAVTLTIAKLLTGIITATHAVGATQAYTLPTGALCDAWPAFITDDYFDWVLINLSAAAADTVTVTADTGHTIVGNPIVQSAHATTGGIYGNSATFRTRKTAASTFVTYRIN